MADDPLAALRRLCLSLPEVTERLSHGEPTWFVRDKKTFVTLSDHHHDDRVGIWAAAGEGVQAELIATDPERYYRPPYVGHRGWIGVDLAVDPDWDEVAGICADAYRTVALKKLAALLGDE